MSHHIIPLLRQTLSKNSVTKLWNFSPFLRKSKLYTKHPVWIQQRLYNALNVDMETGKDSYIIDMRSDVLSQPTPAMRKALSEARIDDDVYGECSVSKSLQERMAKLFGMEAALFVPSGTMGNLICVLLHCDRRGLEVLLGNQSHICLFEAGGVSVLGGVHARQLHNLPDATFDLEEVESMIRPLTDAHQPHTGLICLENSHNVLGGKVVPLEFIEKLKAKADSHNIPVHMDGARIFNAAVAMNKSPAELLKNVDSISACFSKAVGTPIGSIIAGKKEFIDRAVRLRKLLGGGWRGPGILAAAAHVAMDDVFERLAQDHKHAKMIANAINENSQGVLNVDLDGLHTNIIKVDILKPGLTAAEMCARLKQVTDQEKQEMGRSVILRSGYVAKTSFRMYIYSTLSTDDIMLACEKLMYITKEFSKS